MSFSMLLKHGNASDGDDDYDEETIFHHTKSSSSSSNVSLAFTEAEEEEEEDVITTTDADDDDEGVASTTVTSFQEEEHGPHDVAHTDGYDSPWFTRCVATLDGHVDAVTGIAAAAADFLVTASLGHDIVTWRQPGLHRGGVFGAGSGAVKAIVRLPGGGDRIATAHHDRRIRIWRRRGDHFQLAATWPTASACAAAAVSGRGYVAVRRNHRRLWLRHVDSVTCLAAAAAEPAEESGGEGFGVLYSGSWDRSIKVWRISDGRCLESTRAHDDAVSALLVGPAGVLYTASADGSVKAWAKPRGERRHRQLAEMRAHTAAVNALAASADGRAVFSGGSDGAIVAWGSEVSGMFAEIHGAIHAGAPVLCMAAVGPVLCSGGSDGWVRVWAPVEDSTSAIGLRCVTWLRAHRGPVKCLAGTADVAGGVLIYSGGADGLVKVWYVSEYARKRMKHSEM